MEGSLALLCFLFCLIGSAPRELCWLSMGITIVASCRLTNWPGGGSTGSRNEEEEEPAPSVEANHSLIQFVNDANSIRLNCDSAASASPVTVTAVTVILPYN